ncbi:unnamed protein product [Protopolystoma xenopodis]|uniref:Uncharacterized protein n=1 Tax=Protopolystoma xenopodis TaxID=117903 RepID=A0A3S5CQI0_9PLAT|nr:unnamed protein product [Protopolystoma xenopodis]
MLSQEINRNPVSLRICQKEVQAVPPEECASNTMLHTTLAFSLPALSEAICKRSIRFQSRLQPAATFLQSTLELRLVGKTILAFPPTCVKRSCLSRDDDTFRPFQLFSARLPIGQGRVPSPTLPEGSRVGV